MVDCCRGFSFAGKTQARGLTRSDFRIERLDGNEPFENRIASEVDDAHAAGPNPLDYLNRGGECGSKLEKQCLLGIDFWTSLDGLRWSPCAKSSPDPMRRYSR
jgi:hypothetical protein